MPEPYRRRPATLSEAESKELLAGYGLPVLTERLAQTAEGAVAAATDVGLPCVLKLCGDTIAHKTERNLVRLNLQSEAEVRGAANELLAAATPDDGDIELLVAPMVRSNREFIVGADRSDEFGPVVMLGIGGIFAEALEDVVFRLLPATPGELDAMLDDLATQALLGPFRGEAAIDRAQLVGVLSAVGQAMLDRRDITSIDINPVLISHGKAVAVDALVAVS